MKIHKLTDQELEAFDRFITAADQVLNKQKFSFRDPEDNWEEWDNDDPDKQEILQLRKQIAYLEGCEQKEVENKVLMYVWLQSRAIKVRSMTLPKLSLEVLMDNVCDPTETHLAFYPGFELLHVAPEM